jgi:hypothetical protein
VVKLQHGIRFAAGALSLAFGIFVAREIIVNGGLFSQTTNWTPK